ncbi:LamG-like jellyroll fold domain-containing protein [Luteolibacter luteus]|uniref:LamG-like jellyroll fold domain-containing protein n=1 Tax=Luteolibacter luteus TaxID=2728835 RepID=A0A858RP62_9BACT|nr:LamG-like jellyroll fold domain-containing protein [Luteolibacter luteus]QJE98525.1 hypothetical protein HHL09_22965 [Luteolibacter luteus]
MPFPAAMIRRILRFAALVASGCPLAPAAEFHTPNDVDSATLHLWHLDEETIPFSDAGPSPTPLRGLLNGALAGQPSLPGLGTAVSFRSNAGGVPGESNLVGAILAEAPHLVSGNQDNVRADFRYFGKDGAFTYELLIKPEILPGEAGVIASGLLSMDGDGDDRIFNFRIEKQGFLTFMALPHCGATGGGLATIPTTGPHAIATGQWYHVAVTYDGNAGITNNLKLYWTRIDTHPAEANLIGRGTLSNDLNGKTGDLAIGNEARGFNGNAEGEPFPGLIDEVRISGVARHPTDFFFVAPGKRIAPGAKDATAAKPAIPERLDLKLASVLVDASSANLSGKPGEVLRLGSGLHRLDFDFGFSPEPLDADVKLRCQLEGIDERWQETERGMSLTCQALDAGNQVISQAVFSAVGRSDGWETTFDDSKMTRRVEPIYLPAEAVALRLSVSSGSPDTTGLLMVDNIAVSVPGEEEASLWQNGNLTIDGLTPSPGDAPPGWRRDGSDPAIAYLSIRSDGPALALVDGDQMKHGEWTSVQKLNGPPAASRTLVLSWDEAFNVIGGRLNRATYINVPPGAYTFRAIGLAGANQRTGEMIALPIHIDPPFWQRVWFGPAVAAGSVALVAAAAFRHLRRRSKQRLERLRFQNALEQDRSRIARDMHDDLGTRVTVLNLTAALARRDWEKDPAKAQRHLDKMTGAARELVSAMDDLVWAVDPAHDTLDQLGSHLTRLADEMFRDSPVRCRLDIPAELPARPLSAEYRHHIALAVKESLHNVLQHAGPCEVFLSLGLEDETLALMIRDTGRGFDPRSHPDGHGLGNTAGRIREIGGSYALDSSPGHGTSIVLICRLPELPK